MKKVNLIGKLSLKKETISNLSPKQLKELKGGGSLNHISCGGHICGGTTNGRKGCISIAPSVAATCQPGCGTNTCG